jgi:uncharacterized protein
VPLALDRIEEIIERWPYYAAHTIPSGTYPGIDADSPETARAAMPIPLHPGAERFYEQAR